MSTLLEYMVSIHPAEEGGRWLDVPALSECSSSGETIHETIGSIKEAIEGYILALRDIVREILLEEDLIIGRLRVDAVES